MGFCMGYIGWRAPKLQPVIGDSMETLEPSEPEAVIWPKPSKRQRLMIVGVRTERDPALLPCQGACGKAHVKWTWHHAVNSATFQCKDCGNSRRWGLGYSY